MAQAFLVNFPFLFWFNNLNHFRMIFPKTREIEEPCRETVRNDKKSWDSRQNRESWQVCYPLRLTWELPSATIMQQSDLDMKFYKFDFYVYRLQLPYGLASTI